MSNYDLFVIGGGSAGLAAAKRAAKHGAKVALAEPAQLGGTCAARGCIPKKLMVYASEFAQQFEDAVGYGWSRSTAQFEWRSLITAIQQDIDRLDAIHAKSLEEAGIQLFRSEAAFVDTHTLVVGAQRITADKILIAVGGKAIKPKIPGIEHALISDQMFHLTQQPKHLAIVGGGYIGIEFAGIFRGLGSEITQIVREDCVLSSFDELIRTEVCKGMTQHGVRFLLETEVTKVKKTAAGVQLTLSNSGMIEADAVLFATGRVPNLKTLQLENADVNLDHKAIAVDQFSQTNQAHIYAVGDCTNRVQLTPIAIAEGRAFADSVFGHQPHKVRYTNIPSSVFGKPQAACVGLTEDAARQQYGNDQILVYCTMFKPLYHHLSGRDEHTSIKLIVNRQTDRVLGAHMVGEGAAEIIQMAAIAVTAELTKSAFDATLPLHPTTAEEFVTLHCTQMPGESIQPCWM